jgi:hypothetical protein
MNYLCLHNVCLSWYTGSCIYSGLGVLYINLREYQRRNQKWTIQKNWQHCVYKMLWSIFVYMQRHALKYLCTCKVTLKKNAFISVLHFGVTKESSIMSITHKMSVKRTISTVGRETNHIHSWVVLVTLHVHKYFKACLCMYTNIL